MSKSNISHTPSSIGAYLTTCISHPYTYTAPGEDPPLIASNNTKQPKKQKKKNPAKQNNKPQVTPQIDPNLPDICKLEFKVGQITKVWVHPDADKLYCEEIDVGEKDGPRQIASL